MFSEILKIIPKLDTGAMNKMERSLSTRFGKVAKKFGSGLKAAVMGGGLTALTLGVLDKILNPLKETQEAIDAILSRADNLSDMASEFNTSTGNLLKLQTIAKAKGIDPESLSMMMNKFQVKVAEQLADPSKTTAVKNFAVEGGDNADAFFRFIQALQKLTKEQRLLVQKDVFGEKQNIKMSDFLNADFKQMLGGMGFANSADLTARIDKAAELGSSEDWNAARRDYDAFVNGAGVVRGSMLQAKDLNERAKAEAELKKINRQEAMAKIDTNMIHIMSQIDALLGKATQGIANLDQLIKRADRIPGMKMMRGVFGFGKAGE